MVSKQPPLGVGNPQCIDNWCLAGEDVQSAIANRPDPEGAPTNLPHGYRNARSGSAPLRPRLSMWYLSGERSVPRMNTKNKQNEKNQRQKTRQKLVRKKQGQNLNIYQEHEHPETRLTR